MERQALLKSTQQLPIRHLRRVLDIVQPPEIQSALASGCLKNKIQSFLGLLPVVRELTRDVAGTCCLVGWSGQRGDVGKKGREGPGETYVCFDLGVKKEEGGEES
jgi:hypothetical protein